MVEAKHDKLLGGPLSTHYAEKKEGLKLDLACGTNLRPGYVGLDKPPLDDIVKATPSFGGEVPPEYEGYIQADLYEVPWPLADDSIAASYSSHFVEHIPHSHPNWAPDEDGWWVFFKELYRVMEDGGICEFIHPYSRSDRAFWDPTHTRYIHFQTWLYLGRENRQTLGINHTAPDINFQILEVQTIHEPSLLEGRSADVIEYARQFYFNTTDDLFVVLEVQK